MTDPIKPPPGGFFVADDAVPFQWIRNQPMTSPMADETEEDHPAWLRLKKMHERDVLAHAWSIKLIIIAGVLSGIEAVMPLLPTFVQVEQGYFAAGSFLVTVAAFVARLTAQKTISGDRRD